MTFMPTDDPYSNLLTPQDRILALSAGLRGFGSNILSQGYQRAPRSFGQGIGAGMQGFENGQNQALDRMTQLRMLQRRMGREDKQDTRADEQFGLQKDQFARQNKFTDAQTGEIDRKAKMSAEQQASMGKIGEMMQLSGGKITPEIQGEFFKAGLGDEFIKNQFTANKPTDDLREYEYAKGQGFKGSLEDWMQRKRGGAGEYGMQGYWGVGPDGKPGLLQLGKSGKAIAAGMPDGFSLAKDPIKLDLGTEWALLDPQTRQLIKTIPKDVQGKEAAEARGKAQGGIQFDLPRIEQNAGQALQNIDQIRNHPGKQYGLGGYGVIPGIPGTQQKDFVSLVDQAKGKSFLEAFNTLRGGGQITEVEGKKATDAIARLDRTQSKEGFEQALADLEEVIKTGVERARKQAGGQTPKPAQTQRLKFDAQGNQVQ